jgi:hypothetical protein
MRKFRGLFIAILLVAGLMPAVAAPVFASCATEQIVLYENTAADGLGDALQRCVSAPNLDQVPHVPAGLCNSQFFRFTDSWNDCVSSYRVTLPANRCARLYENAGYGGAVLKVVTGPTNALFQNFGAAQNDRLSSVLFYTKVGGVC